MQTTNKPEPRFLWSHQHGAIFMAFMPCFYGVWLAGPQFRHAFFIATWSACFLLSYPLLELTKSNRKKNLMRKWILIYSTAATFFSVIALYLDWQMIFFAGFLTPFFFINIHYAKQRNERDIINDLAAVAGFAVIGAAAYWFGNNLANPMLAWQAAWVPTLFFIGSILHVKSLIREKHNPSYLQASWFYHLALPPTIFIFSSELALCFLVGIMRLGLHALAKPKLKLIGFTELIVALLFFFLLITVA